MFSKHSGGISKTAIQIIVVIALVGAVMLSGSPDATQARLTLHLDGVERVFAGDVTENMTVLDALNAATSAGGVPLQFFIDESKDVTVIKRLSGYKNPARISVFVNGRLIDAQKIHTTPLRQQDTVVVKLDE